MSNSHKDAPRWCDAFAAVFGVIACILIGAGIHSHFKAATATDTNISELESSSKAVAQKISEPPKVVLSVARPSNWLRDGAIVGEHAVRLATFEINGRTWYLGCVPCFNLMTTVAVIDGRVYGLNAITNAWAKNFRARVDGTAVPVADDSKLNGVVHANIDMSTMAQSVAGCDAGDGPDLMGRLVDAVNTGRCLGN